MAISGPVSNPLQSWTSLFDRLRSSGLSFKQMLEVMADAKWSPLYVEGLPALYKARVLCYLLCEVAARYVSQQNVHVGSLDTGGRQLRLHLSCLQRYPRESSDLEWFGRQLGGSCKAELLQTLGRTLADLIVSPCYASRQTTSLILRCDIFVSGDAALR